jgi:hypothetical protein
MWQSDCESGENSLKITTAVENAKDCDGIGCDQERYHRAAFETESPQAAAQVVAPDAALRKHRKIAATIFNAVDVANRAFSTVAHGDVVVEAIKSPSASGLNLILRLTPLLQPIGMPGANGGKNLLSGDGAAGVRLHGVADFNNFLTQPLLDCCVTLLQCSQPGAHNFAAGSIAAGCNKSVDVTSLLGGQAESSLFR